MSASIPQKSYLRKKRVRNFSDDFSYLNNERVDRKKQSNTKNINFECHPHDFSYLNNERDGSEEAKQY